MLVKIKCKPKIAFHFIWEIEIVNQISSPQPTTSRYFLVIRSHDRNQIEDNSKGILKVEILEGSLLNTHTHTHTHTHIQQAAKGAVYKLRHTIDLWKNMTKGSGDLKNGDVTKFKLKTF